MAMSDEKIDKGGPAFPIVRMPLDPDTTLNHPGMSMRDWFAGQALAGLLARDLIGSSGGSNAIQWANVRDDDSYRMPRLAYQYADAMLAARDRK